MNRRALSSRIVQNPCKEYLLQSLPIAYMARADDMSNFVPRHKVTQQEIFGFVAKRENPSD